MNESLDFQGKSFFQKPEGKLGKVVIVLAIIAFCIGLYYLLPYILILLTNTLHAMFLIGAITLLLFLVTNKRIQTLVSFAFKSLMYWLTSMFVELNPIRVMKIHIENLKNNLVKMNEHITNLSGQIRLLERKISSNKEEVEQSLQVASSAKDNNKKMEAWKHVRKAERRRQNTIKLSELLTQIKKVHIVLSRMYEVSSYVIEDLEDDIQQKEIEYKTIKEAHAALKSSMSILNGNPDERAMFELALEKMEEDVSKKLGTMDRFMYMSESLLTSIDLEQGVLAENGMLMLEEFEDGAFDEFFKEFDAKDIKSKMTAPERLAFDSDLKSFNESQSITHENNGKYFDI